MDIPVPVAVKPLSDYRINFSHLAGKGVFKFWNDYTNFQRVYITDAGAIAWSADIEVCPDATYMRLTGKSAEDLLPSLQTAASDV